jgi:hypothetical protein
MTTLTRIDALITRLEAAMQASDDDEIRWSGPASEAAITAVERALGASIHGSFRDLMLRTGGGGLDTFAISSIPATEPLGGLGTVHGDTLHYRQDWWTTSLPPHLIVIQRSLDDNEPFCLDTSRIKAGENPVVLFYHQTHGGKSEPIADSFIDFLEAYLEPYFKDSSGEERA